MIGGLAAIVTFCMFLRRVDEYVCAEGAVLAIEVLDLAIDISIDVVD